MRRALYVFLAAVLVAIPATASARKQQPPVVVAADPSGSFELVGHEPLLFRGMNAAIAVHGDYAYVGSRTDGLHPNSGVAIVDISDPSSPTRVGQIGPPNEGNVGETSREMRIWPEKNLLIVLNLASNCSFIIHACSPTQLVGQDNYRFYDISGDKAAAPELVATYEPSINPHEFYLWQDPKDSDRALIFQSTPSGPQDKQMLVTDISGAADGKFEELGTWGTVIPDPSTDNRLHSLAVSPDGTKGYISYLGGGFLMIDTSDFAKGVAKPKADLITPVQDRVTWGDPGVHSAVPFPGRDYVWTTDEVYGEIPVLLAGHGCPWGWSRVVDVKNPRKPKVLAEYKLPQNTEEFCSSQTDNDPVRNATSSWAAHNPTLTRNLAILTWHSGGLQAVDISKPGAPAQAAEFKPEPLPVVTQEDPALSSGRDKVVMWSYPVIKDGLIYVSDVRNGFFILRYKGPFEKEVSSIDFLEGNSNLGDALKIFK
ncbi:MAG: hypothetical protein M3273_01430 [Actinomycetota bacterium]|nr:hypothetical protein [Actinomycetota bacterium]